MAEFALSAPLLILLFFGLTLAAFYAFRSAAADWGIFITGIAEGAYETPATGQALESVYWQEIRSKIASGPLVESRQVRSQIELYSSRPWIFGIQLTEAQQATVYFRLWRFYAGPPTGVVE